MSSSTATASPSTLPYPNALQARQTSEAHRRTAAAAVLTYDATLTEEETQLKHDDIVLSEEEAARLQGRVEMLKTANATAAQLRQRATDVLASIDGDEQRALPGKGLRTDHVLGVYHAACDGDVGALTAWVDAVRPASSLSAQINALGQPDPATYNGAQFQQRWLFRAPPLVFAAAFGREDAVRFLLAHGADPKVKASTGLRAIDYAQKRGYTEIVAMLS